MQMASVTSTAHRPNVVLGTEHSTELFLRWQQAGDRAAREALVQRYMPLARNLARRYGRSSAPFEDLLQVASLGLLKALDRFDPERGHAFPSFAVPTILGEMRRYFRDSGWSVHVPRGVQERALKVRDAQEHIAGERGHAPTVRQLAEYLELDTEEIVDALQAIRSYETLSLDAPHAGADNDDATTYGEGLGGEDGHYELVELGPRAHPGARAPHPAHALRRRSDSDGDRGSGGSLPDAGLAPAASFARTVASAHGLRHPRGPLEVIRATQYIHEPSDNRG
jgi:RNA polymerase sigma-B factor